MATDDYDRPIAGGFWPEPPPGGLFGSGSQSAEIAELKHKNAVLESTVEILKNDLEKARVELMRSVHHANALAASFDSLLAEARFRRVELQEVLSEITPSSPPSPPP